MDYPTFIKAVESRIKPTSLNRYLEAMYHDGIGDWEGSHNVAQDIPDQMGSLIHAFLHRKEGDNWNANYWYNKAGRKMPEISLDEEWNSIVKELLN